MKMKRMKYERPCISIVSMDTCALLIATSGKIGRVEVDIYDKQDAKIGILMEGGEADPGTALSKENDVWSGFDD